ncbi:MAG: hypothetical protein ABIL86_04340 [candidate division WOR-3 bacterium]
MVKILQHIGIDNDCPTRAKVASLNLNHNHPTFSFNHYWYWHFRAQ